MATTILSNKRIHSPPFTSSIVDVHCFKAGKGAFGLVPETHILNNSHVSETQNVRAKTGHLLFSNCSVDPLRNWTCKPVKPTATLSRLVAKAHQSQGPTV